MPRWPGLTTRGPGHRSLQTCLASCRWVQVSVIDSAAFAGGAPAAAVSSARLPKTISDVTQHGSTLCQRRIYLALHHILKVCLQYGTLSSYATGMPGSSAHFIFRPCASGLPPQELASKRLAADQRTFEAITVQLIEPVWAQWGADTATLQAALPAALEAPLAQSQVCWGCC